MMVFAKVIKEAMKAVADAEVEALDTRDDLWWQAAEEGNPTYPLALLSKLR